METNVCNVGNLDADAHLPPRKRLLAELKRQNSDVNTFVQLPGIPGAMYKDIHGCRMGNHNHLNGDIVEASRIAAFEAAKVAEAARAIAEDKAAKAAKAVAAAKSALEFVASLSEDGEDEIILKKNKMKRHVPVEALYNKNKGHTNCGTDEQLAHNLHRVINSSPRILENSSSPNTKSHRLKRLKNSALSGRASNVVAVRIANVTSMAKVSGDNTVEDVGIDDSMNMKPGKVDKWEPNNPVRLNLAKGEAVALQLKNKFINSLDSSVKKRGRIKQKKLPLSICNFRDQVGSKGKDNAVRSQDFNGQPVGIIIHGAF